MDVETLRAEIAKRHGTLLGREDPIFVTVTLNELVIEDFFRRAQVAAEEVERRAAGGYARSIEDAKRGAESLVVGAATYFAQEVRRAAGQAEASIDASLRGKLEAIAAAADTARNACKIALVASGVAAAATLVALGMIVGGMR